MLKTTRSPRRMLALAKRHFHLVRGVPIGLFGHFVPVEQRPPGVRMPLPELAQRSLGDNPHGFLGLQAIIAVAVDPGAARLWRRDADGRMHL